MDRGKTCEDWQVSGPKFEDGNSQRSRSADRRVATFGFYIARTPEPVPVAARSKVQVLTAWLLGSWVRIPLGTWMFVFEFVLPCALCEGLITRPNESYRVS
jgi:hypothetical protein